MIAYTDGSCLGNPGPGGWAWALVGGPTASGAERSTTNQRMELTAALEAMQWIVDHIDHLVGQRCDSRIIAGGAVRQSGTAAGATGYAVTTQINGTFDECNDLADRTDRTDRLGLTTLAGGVTTSAPSRSCGSGIDPVRLTIISDSSYLVNCFSHHWWEGWIKKGWRNAKGDGVANRDLWEPLLHLVLDGPIEVNFSWTRGHSGDAMNELVDAMANEAARTQRGSGPA